MFCFPEIIEKKLYELQGVNELTSIGFKVLSSKRIEKGWGGFEDWVEVLDNNLETEEYKMERIGEVFAYHFDKNNYHEPSEIKEVETVKVLYIAQDKRLSLHFHEIKQEIFYMIEGAVNLYLNAAGNIYKTLLEKGDKVFIPRCLPHSMEGVLENNILLEVSTLDRASDSKRIIKGD